MYFSECFGIINPKSHEWFDQILDSDTRLFVDPFNIFKEPEESFWASAHGRLISYIQDAFEILAGSHRNEASLPYKEVLDMMTFPEPVEFGLGFVASGQQGSGTGKGFARLMVKAMAEAIERGLMDMRHFEELGLLVEGIGRDRISDITCNVLKPQFVEYTQQVCSELGIPCEDLQVPHSVFDQGRRRWSSGRFGLPRNPETGKAIILLPKRFLDELPSLTVDEWWEWLSNDLRDDLNFEVNSNLSKGEIIQKARAHTDLVREWVGESEEKPAQSYNVDRDPEGLHNWQERTRDFCSSHPLDIGPIRTEEDLNKFMEKILAEFKHQVEEQGLWRLLWNDDTGKPKRELSIQLLFKGVVQSYCRAYSILMSREVELGRGPVDFMFAKDAKVRLLVEIKRMNNGRFWDGLGAQLTSYIHSDQCRNGWLLAVRFSDSGAEKERSRELSERTAHAARMANFNLRSDWIDARPKKSASKLSLGDDGIARSQSTTEPDGS